MGSTLISKDKTFEHFKQKFMGETFTVKVADHSGNMPIHLPEVDRLAMAQTMAELGFNIGAEIGVAAGDHAKLLMDTIPDLVLYCIDPWRRVDGYTSFDNGKLWRWHNEAVQKLAGRYCIFMEETSMEAVSKITDELLDFVYIDGAHDFRHIAEDLCMWVPKVKPGGIIYGHDFVNIPGGRYPCHVKYVVEAYTSSFNISPWFILTKSERNDGIPSWMFIR